MRPSGLLHPVALAALALLVVNDHVLKAAYPGAVTGKLSDFAGLVVFPLLAAALAGRVLPARWYPRVVDAAVVATAVGFTLVKLWEPATVACEGVLGALRWPFTGVAARVDIVRDATDLVALSMLAVAQSISTRTERAAPVARSIATST